MRELASPTGDPWVVALSATGPSPADARFFTPRGWRAAAPITRGLVAIGVLGAVAFEVGVVFDHQGEPGSLFAWVVFAVAGAFIGALTSMVALLALVVLGLAVMTLALLAVLLLMILLLLSSAIARRPAESALTWGEAGMSRALAFASAVASRLGRRLRVASAPAVQGPALRGEIIEVAAEPCLVLAGREEHADVCDAAVHPFEVALEDGERVRVELGAGELHVDTTALQPAGAGDVAPAWWGALSKSPPRRAPLAPGARVELAGGAWTDRASPHAGGGGFRHAPRQRVLVGTAAAPISLRLVSAAPA